MYNKAIIKFGFSDIQNKQGKGYQPQPLAFFFHMKLKIKKNRNLLILKKTAIITLFWLTNGRKNNKYKTRDIITFAKQLVAETITTRTRRKELE